MSGMSERDPRVDPKPGDVLIYGPQWQRTRSEVIATTLTGVAHAIDGSDHSIGVSLKKWREWMRGAEVIHRAEETSTEDAR